LSTPNQRQDHTASFWSPEDITGTNPHCTNCSQEGDLFKELGQRYKELLKKVATVTGTGNPAESENPRNVPPSARAPNPNEEDKFEEIPFCTCPELTLLAQPPERPKAEWKTG
jgi:hypothetical protein